jgi:hypothetical protein
VSPRGASARAAGGECGSARQQARGRWAANTRAAGSEHQGAGSRHERPGNDRAGVGLSTEAKEARGTQSVGVGAIMTNYKFPDRLKGWKA